MSNNFKKTILNNEVYEYEISKSKFIAFSYFVQNEAEIKNIIEKHKKKYFDARHNVYAYILNNNIYKYSDDGEPSKTSGYQILNVLEKNQYNNVLIIVTRYFGGILLGTGGLTKAYTTSAIGVLNKSKKAKLIETKKYILNFEYKYMSEIKNILKKLSIDILNENFLEKIELEILIEENIEIELINKIQTELINKKIEYEIIEKFEKYSFRKEE